MYGTVAKLHVKSGMEDAMKQQMEGFESVHVPGFVRATVYRMDDDPSVYYLAVVFESKEAYHANANDPAQNTRYEQMRSMLTEDPEWHDGEITHITA